MERRQLSGWKQIAGFFEVAEKTVQNWEAHGLPVHRVRGRVHAFAEELEEWKEAQDRAPRRSRRRFIELRLRLTRSRLAVAVVVVALATGWLFLSWRGSLAKPVIAEATLEASVLTVLDRKGQEIWSRRFPPVRDRLLSFYQEPVQPLVMDVDADGMKEVLVSLTPEGRRNEEGRLLCLDSEKRERWEFVYGRELRVGGRPFPHVFGLVFLDRVLVEGKTLLLVISRHWPYYPTQVALVDPATGALLDEYWHPGYVYSRLLEDFDGDGQPEVLLGATNNPDFGPGYPALVLLDLPFGPARVGQEAEMNPFGAENARELVYLLFPLPDVARVQDTGASVVRVEVEGPDRIRADLSLGTDKVLFYSMSRKLDVVGLRASSSFVREHARVEAAGLLDHRFTEEELARDLQRAVRFPTAPHGNSPEVVALLETSGG